MISVIGCGYVGLAMSCLLSSKHKVIAIDNDVNKVDLINSGISPIEDYEIGNFLKNNSKSLMASTDYVKAIKNSEYLIIALPTNYNEELGEFDTSIIENFLDKAEANNFSGIVIVKSTIPVGFTEYLNKKYIGIDFIFSPEFLREGTALKDNYYPSRMVIGSSSETLSNKFYNLIKPCIKTEKFKLILTGYNEAEIIKLAANSYLALRVSFFNELDNYMIDNNLEAKSVIEGICSDQRIGNIYNNPSFGYGGYCLPKDSKQMLALFKDIGTDIFRSIVISNSRRIEFIANDILKYKPQKVCLYKLAMKAGSDNFRESAILKVSKILIENGVDVVFYDNSINAKKVEGIKKIDSIDSIEDCDLVLANRLDDEIKVPIDKIYTRDVFSTD